MLFSCSELSSPATVHEQTIKDKLIKKTNKARKKGGTQPNSRLKVWNHKAVNRSKVKMK